MNKNICNYFILLLVVISISNCEIEKYTGYNYEGKSLIRTKTVSGTITNEFTDEPVYRAYVQIGIQSTLTDEFGFFSLEYELFGDEDKDKPVPISVSKEQYYSYSDSIIIYPEQNVHYIEMKYGAPIIERIIAKLSTFGDCIDTCQAIVYDYQGISNIDLVETILSYQMLDAEGNFIMKKIRVPMDLIRTVSGKGHYQYINNLHFEEVRPGMMKIYQMLAKDHDGFESITVEISWPLATDSLLFPPN